MKGPLCAPRQRPQSLQARVTLIESGAKNLNIKVVEVVMREEVVNTINEKVDITIFFAKK